MENDVRQYLKKLDPRNLNLTIKIILLVSVLVAIITIIFFSIGLTTLKNSLLSSAALQLEELCYLKSDEVEKEFALTSEKLLRIAETDEIKSAAREYTRTFHLLQEETGIIIGQLTQDEIAAQISTYYSDILVPLAPVTSQKLMFSVPSDEKTRIAQYIYLIKNPKAYAERDKFIKMNEDNSSYALAQSSYHNFFLRLREQLNASDIFLADAKSGYIVYSASRNIDFGANILDGELKDSKLSEAFRKAKASVNPEVFYTDFSVYAPASDRPSAFLSIPIIESGITTSIIIIQYDTRLFDLILTREYMAAGESSLEYTIIGEDLKLRNNPKTFILDKEKVIKILMKRSDRSQIENVLAMQKTESIALLTSYSKKHESQLQAESAIETNDYLDNEVILYSKALDIPGALLFLQAKKDRAEILKPFSVRLQSFVIITLILLSVAFFIAYSFGSSIKRRVQKLLDAMVLVHNGEKTKAIDTIFHDEIGEATETFNKLRKRVNNAEEFALEMSEGNYSYNFEILSERDNLGKSLNVLKEKLIQSRDEHEERTREDEIRNWINTGIAKFNDLLRQNNTDIKLLAYSIIENLVAYTGANIGGVFLIEGEKESEKYIELAASYAYDRRKYYQKRVEINEGLLGACYLEKKPIFLRQIPEDYIEIVSGLGHQVPKNLYIVPLKVDEDVLGIMEIASGSDLEKFKIEFINQVSNSIAATFISVRLNMKTATLLEESNRRAEEITQQEEEMRQNLEEMQATQEELARLRQDDEKHRREMQLIIDNTRLMLRNLLDAIPGGYVLKDQNGIIHLANAEGAEIYGLSPDRVLGKTDHELLGGKIYEAEHKRDTEVIEKGELNFTEEREIKGEKRKYNVIKKPFNIKEIGQMGILTIRHKV